MIIFNCLKINKPKIHLGQKKSKYKRASKYVEIIHAT